MKVTDRMETIFRKSYEITEGPRTKTEDVTRSVEVKIREGDQWYCYRSSNWINDVEPEDAITKGPFNLQNVNQAIAKKRPGPETKTKVVEKRPKLRMKDSPRIHRGYKRGSPGQSPRTTSPSSDLESILGFSTQHPSDSINTPRDRISRSINSGTTHDQQDAASLFSLPLQSEGENYNSWSSSQTHSPGSTIADAVYTQVPTLPLRNLENNFQFPAPIPPCKLSQQPQAESSPPKVRKGAGDLKIKAEIGRRALSSIPKYKPPPPLLLSPMDSILVL